jgi:hypothetical protein
MATNLLLDPTSASTATVTGITQPARPRAVDYPSRAAFKTALAAWQAAHQRPRPTPTPTPTPAGGNPDPSSRHRPGAASPLSDRARGNRYRRLGWRSRPISYTPTPVTTPPVSAPRQYLTAPTAAQAVTAALRRSAPASTPARTLPALQRRRALRTLLTNSLLSQDSDLMKQARTTGLKEANARGVLNSSIGIGAAQNEAIKAALPLAAAAGRSERASNQQRYDLSAQMDRLRAQAGFEQIARAEGYSYQSSLNTQGYAFRRSSRRTSISSRRTWPRSSRATRSTWPACNSRCSRSSRAKRTTSRFSAWVDFANQWKLQQQQAQNVLDQIKAQGDVQLTLQANQFRRR